MGVAGAPPEFMAEDTRRPTIILANTATMNAAQTNPFQVAGQAKSAAHGRLGAPEMDIRFVSP
jgi:hypothetical protein